MEEKSGLVGGYMYVDSVRSNDSRQKSPTWVKQQLDVVSKSWIFVEGAIITICGRVR